MGVVYNNVGGIIIQEKKLLVNREKNHVIFLVPGGGIKTGESPEEALTRELKEELGINIGKKDLASYASFSGEATNRKDVVRMQTFIVNINGQIPEPHSDIEELNWIISNDIDKVKLGWILKNKLLTKLKSEGLIS